MAKDSEQRTLKSYRAPWEEQLLLACGKCQRKLRHGEDEAGLGKLTKALKKASKRGRLSLGLFVINTPCLDVCPKDGVVVCTRAQVGKERFSILRTKADVHALLIECGRADTKKGGD